MQVVTRHIIIGVAVGLILGIGSMLIGIGQKNAKLEAQIEALKEQISHISSSEISDTEITKNPPSTPEAEREKSLEITKELIEIIKEKQANHVRESWGHYDFECFTAEDLEEFKTSKVINKIESELKGDNRFIDIVLAIKQIAPREWQTLKELCLKTYKPTWDKIGKMDRKGQTEAGQNAEKMIAEAIVRLVTDLRRKSVEDIKKLYSY